MKGRAALVLIDLQTAAFDGVAIPPIHESDLLLRNACRLLDAARGAGAAVVHVQHCASPGEVFAEDAPGWPTVLPLAPRTGETVILKRTANAFEGTDLHAVLTEIGFGVLVIAGLQTEHCVAATCRGALRLGYEVNLADDAHSTWPDKSRSAGEIVAAERAALHADGVVLSSTADLVETLARARSVVPE